MVKVYLVDISKCETVPYVFKNICEKHSFLSKTGIALAKYAIKKEFHIPIKNQEFLYQNSGKPVLQGYPHIHFNISHSENLVACAVSDAQVGIDIQKIKKHNAKTEAYIGLKEGQNFFELWTKKEATVKKTGGSIFCKNIKTLDVTNTKTTKYKDYYISIAY